MKVTEFEAAVLDMDGVVTRTASVHARVWKEMFDEYLQKRIERDGESQEPFDIINDYKRYVDGKPRYEGVKSFIESRGIHLPYGDPGDDPYKETVCGLGNRKDRLFREVLYREGVDVFEDTVEQIKRWKAHGVKVGIFSSSRNCPEVLEAAGLSGLFDAKVDGNDLDQPGLRGKPAPDMPVETAHRLGAEPENTVIAEDAIAGVEAGRRGGFGLVVGVDRDGSASGLRKAGADIVLRDLRDVAAAGYCVPDEDCLLRPSSGTKYAGWIADRLQDKRLALFLDYDGTLTPIVRRPEDAVLSEEMRSLVQRLAESCTVAVVSGRDRGDVETMVGIDSLTYAGSHGYDIKGPGGLELQHEAARGVSTDLDDAERALVGPLERIRGAWIERKRFAIAVHYREVKGEDDIRRVEKAVDEERDRHPSLRKMSGKKVFELQPDVEWDKGRAIEWLRESLGMNAPDVVTIYVGDDTTDEDAFRMLRRRGFGIGIRVGNASERTEALYYLRDCDEVRQFLGLLAENLSGSRRKGKEI